MNTIYTAIIGPYDTLKEPTIYTPQWDYICFTDQKHLRSDVWKIVNIDKLDIPEGLDDIRKARYIKIMFHKVLKDSDISIWMDASMQVNCNLDEFIKTFYSGKFTTLSHPDRQCIYNEAIACMKLGKDDRQTITQQMDHYWIGNYPQNNGLAATGIIIREPNEFNQELCRWWWEQIKAYSKRDQLSFNYILREVSEYFMWNTGLTCDDYQKTVYSTIPFYVILKHFIINKHNGR